jgi:hypothetical protein
MRVNSRGVLVIGDDVSEQFASLFERLLPQFSRQIAKFSAVAKATQAA